jgi:nicotinate-nucleotide adenylyltransferase
LICLFGGTFDPVHVGHVHAAMAVCDALDLPEIRLLLSARPGHRGTTGAPVAQRWRMLELACAEDPRLVPDATEVRRGERLGRPSYTVETLEEIRAGQPRAVVAWVVGSDTYRDLTSWHRWREVLDLANLVVLRRPGAPLELPGELDELTRARQIEGRPRQPGGGVLLLDAPMRDVSATRVRAALGGGPLTAADVADLLPPAVYTYIKKYHLYGVVGDA